MTLHEVMSAPVEFQATASVVGLDGSESDAAESIRALRTQLVSGGDRQRVGPVAICGPGEEVGATFVAVNLAVALAQVGCRTLLIDADLRDPKVHEMIIPPSQSEGLVHWLDGTAELEDVIHQDVLPNLSVMFAGSRSSNPQEALAQPRFTDLIAMSSQEYDFTVVDTPPAHKSADSRLISAVVGSALVIARKDETSVSDLKTLVAELEQSGTRVLGVVLNEF